MQIICFNCRQSWDVPEGSMLGARLKFGLGFKDHTFICPNCETKNLITAEEFETADHPPPQIPVTGTHPQDVAYSESRYSNRGLTGKAPTNPIEGPGPSTRQRHGVVLARSLDLRRDHSVHAEVMGNLKDGDRLTILGTWTNGEDVWVQLGPERWAPIEQEGEAIIELTDD